MAAKTKTLDELGFTFTPKGGSQRRAAEAWVKSRIVFLLGESGTGKTACGLGLALNHMLQHPKSRLWLTRPQVTVAEDCGFLPGDLREKIGPFLGPFYDVFSSCSNATWEDLEKTMDKRLEICPLGYMRGRTVRQSVLVGDELQNATEAQLLCLLTRIGQGGKMILCGDHEQSDRFSIKASPLMKIATKLASVEGISVIHFSPEDQLRDPLVSRILAAL